MTAELTFDESITKPRKKEPQGSGLQDAEKTAASAQQKASEKEKKKAQGEKLKARSKEYAATRSRIKRELLHNRTPQQIAAITSEEEINMLIMQILHGVQETSGIETDEDETVILRSGTIRSLVEATVRDYISQEQKIQEWWDGVEKEERNLPENLNTLSETQQHLEEQLHTQPTDAVKRELLEALAPNQEFPEGFERDLLLIRTHGGIAFFRTSSDSFTRLVQPIIAVQSQDGERQLSSYNDVRHHLRGIPRMGFKYRGEVSGAAIPAMHVSVIKQCEIDVPNYTALELEVLAHEEEETLEEIEYEAAQQDPVLRRLLKKSKKYTTARAETETETEQTTEDFVAVSIGDLAARITSHDTLSLGSIGVTRQFAREHPEETRLLYAMLQKAQAEYSAITSDIPQEEQQRQRQHIADRISGYILQPENYLLEDEPEGITIQDVLELVSEDDIEEELKKTDIVGAKRKGRFIHNRESILPGEIVDGKTQKYKMISSVGGGAFGRTYIMEVVGTGQRVIAKEALVDTSEALFLNEDSAEAYVNGCLERQDGQPFDSRKDYDPYRLLSDLEDADDSGVLPNHLHRQLMQYSRRIVAAGGNPVFDTTTNMLLPGIPIAERRDIITVMRQFCRDFNTNPSYAGDVHTLRQEMSATREKATREYEALSDVTGINGIPGAIELIEGNEPNTQARKISFRRLLVIQELALGKELNDVIPAQLLTATWDQVRLVEGYSKFLDALSQANSRGVIHRDIKPENIYINGYDFSLIDWGEASTRKHPKNEAIGTPGYSPLEQYRKNPGLPSNTDARSDVYAASVVLYRILTKKGEPDGAPTLAVTWPASFAPLETNLINAGVDKTIIAAIKKGMDPTPNNRHQTAKEMADALEAWIRTKQVIVSPNAAPLFPPGQPLQPMQPPVQPGIWNPNAPLPPGPAFQPSPFYTPPVNVAPQIVAPIQLAGVNIPHNPQVQPLNVNVLRVGPNGLIDQADLHILMRNKQFAANGQWNQWENFEPSIERAGMPDCFITPESRIGSFRVASGSDRGEKRLSKPDEDTILVERVKVGKRDTDETIMILADGMGGHANGKQASETITNTVRQRYLDNRKRIRGIPTTAQIQQALEEAVTFANAELHALNTQSGSDMGSTCVVSVLTDAGDYVVVNVGDSRAYKVDQQNAVRITEDHSFVEGLVQAGSIQPDERYTHPRRNWVLKSMGEQATVGFDTFTGKLATGEQMLLCCDGLWEMTRDSDGEVIRQIARSDDNQSEVARRLIALANYAGGEDNISVVLAKMDPLATPPGPVKPKRVPVQHLTIPLPLKQALEKLDMQPQVYVSGLSKLSPDIQIFLTDLRAHATTPLSLSETFEGLRRFIRKGGISGLGELAAAHSMNIVAEESLQNNIPLDKKSLELWLNTLGKAVNDSENSLETEVKNYLTTLVSMSDSMPNSIDVAVQGLRGTMAGAYSIDFMRLREKYLRDAVVQVIQNAEKHSKPVTSQYLSTLEAAVANHIYEQSFRGPADFPPELAFYLKTIEDIANADPARKKEMHNRLLGIMNNSSRWETYLLRPVIYEEAERLSKII